MSEWIKCSERIPDEDVPVLVWNQHDGFDVGWQHNGFWFGPTWNDSLAPSHWMPLPEQPR
ncbi:hypothetical protein D9M68_835860 [compost metagenome]